VTGDCHAGILWEPGGAIPRATRPLTARLDRTPALATNAQAQEDQGPTTTPKTFTRINNRESNHENAGKQQRANHHPALLRSLS